MTTIDKLVQRLQSPVPVDEASQKLSTAANALMTLVSRAREAKAALESKEPRPETLERLEDLTAAEKQVIYRLTNLVEVETEWLTTQAHKKAVQLQLAISGLEGTVQNSENEAAS
jgi:hypothetical protein